MEKADRSTIENTEVVLKTAVEIRFFDSVKEKENLLEAYKAIISSNLDTIALRMKELSRPMRARGLKLI